MAEDTEEKIELFAVYAVRKNEATPLLQTHLSFGRLMDDIVVPYESGEMFFIDGASLKATDLDRIKIIQQLEFFNDNFKRLHKNLRRGEQQELYGKQYDVRLEALLRESGEDVTSQAINAYRTAIKPKLKDYLPDKDVLITAAVKVFAESMKSLAGV